MLFFSAAIALIVGSYVGKLIVQYWFNSGASPLDTVEQVSEYEIIKTFEEESK